MATTSITATILAEFLPAFVAFREQRLVLFFLPEAVAGIAARANSLIEVITLVLAVRRQNLLAAAQAAFSAFPLELIPE